jgi:hypothetical protein
LLQLLGKRVRVQVAHRRNGVVGTGSKQALVLGRRQHGDGKHAGALRRLDAVHGILDHGAPFRRHAQALRRLEEHFGVRFSLFHVLGGQRRMHDGRHPELPHQHVDVGSRPARCDGEAGTASPQSGEQDADARVDEHRALPNQLAIQHLFAVAKFRDTCGRRLPEPDRNDVLVTLPEGPCEQSIGKADTGLAAEFLPGAPVRVGAVHQHTVHVENYGDRVLHGHVSSRNRGTSDAVNVPPRTPLRVPSCRR